MDIGKLQPEAEAGSVVAQGLLGNCYLYGEGAQKDHATALRWLRSAAQRGASLPTFHLGRMYEEGWGVAMDHQRAGQLYKKASDRGEWLGYVQRARLYRYGRGNPVNEQAAFERHDVVLSESEPVESCPELEEARAYVALHDGRKANPPPARAEINSGCEDRGDTS
jgi:TPR repeat protein